MKKIMSFVLAGIIGAMSIACLSACGDGDSPVKEHVSKSVVESATAEADEDTVITAPTVITNNPSAETSPSAFADIEEEEFEDTEEAAMEYALDTLTAKAYSYSSLLEKLERKGYSEENATYALDNCGANWYEEAYKKAIDYLIDSPFSYNSLVDQLQYDGFLYEEAVYAVDNCGADWNEQAATEAQNYIDYSEKNGEEASADLVRIDLETSLFMEAQINYAMAEVGLS